MKGLIMSDRDSRVMRVIKSLSRLRIDGLAMPVHRADGVAPIVVALPSDEVGYIESLVEAAGGEANLVLALEDRFVLWSWSNNTTATLDTIEVHEGATMDMLELWVAQCEGAASINLIRASLGAARELQYQD